MALYVDCSGHEWLAQAMVARAMELGAMKGCRGCKTGERYVALYSDERNGMFHGVVDRFDILPMGNKSSGLQEALEVLGDRPLTLFGYPISFQCDGSVNVDGHVFASDWVNDFIARRERAMALHVVTN